MPTKDGHLFARHENELSGTTDVASRPELANRKTTKLIDGVAFTGSFSEDFTLAEIKTLRAKERIPDVRPRKHALDRLFEIPTLREVIGLVIRVEEQTVKNRHLSQTKYPTHFQKEGTFLSGAAINSSLAELLIKTLVEEGLTHPARIFFPCGPTPTGRVVCGSRSICSLLRYNRAP